jgi:hypothetical protein
VADVRKVGENEYEIAPHRHEAAGAPAPGPAALAVAPEPAVEAAGEPGTSGGGNGQRPGIRFRRGSRGGVPAGQVPLIGAVAEAAPPEPEPAGPVTEGAKPAGARRRGRGGRRAAPKGESQEASSEPASEVQAEPAAPKRRSRPRARKKPE